jgi:hypothetical protein
MRTSNSNCEICRCLCATKEEMVIQDMINRLSDTERCYGMEMNVEKTKGMTISKQPFPLQIVIYKK